MLHSSFKNIIDIIKKDDTTVKITPQLLQSAVENQEIYPAKKQQLEKFIGLPLG